MDTQVSAALIAAGATILAAAAAAGIVMWQIGHGERLKLKQKLYEQILETIRRYFNAQSKLSTPVLFLKAEAADWRDPTYRLNARPPRYRSVGLTGLRRRLVDAAIDLIYLIEQYQVIDERLPVFRAAIASGLYDLQEAWEPFWYAALRVLPLDDVPDESPQSIANWKPPEAEVASEIENAGEIVFQQLNTMHGFVVDLQNEMQNLLLSGLFKSKVPPRKPVLLDVVVVTLERHAELMRHFEEDTAWGRNNHSVIESVRAGDAKEATPGIHTPSG